MSEVNLDDFVFEMDGNMWCAHRPDFVDLQQSVAGFGATKLDALADLLRRENKSQKKLDVD